MLIIIGILAIFFLGFVTGSGWSEASSVNYWLKYKYCQTCNRLDCKREHG